MDRQRRAGRIGHVETQFAGPILRRQKLRQADQKGCKDSCTQEVRLHLFLLDAAGCALWRLYIWNCEPAETDLRGSFWSFPQSFQSANMTQDRPNK